MMLNCRTILGIFYIKNQAIWLAERILGPKLKNQTIKTAWNNWINLLLLWMATHMQKTTIIELSSVLAICTFNIGNYGMSRCAWPLQYEWTGFSRCIYVCLTTCKEIRFIPKLIFEIQLNHCFQLFWTCLITHTWNDSTNL